MAATKSGDTLALGRRASEEADKWLRIFVSTSVGT
jgi:hypothetical protein